MAVIFRTHTRAEIKKKRFWVSFEVLENAIHRYLFRFKGKPTKKPGNAHVRWPVY
jgi:hypothetical protein